MRKIGSQFSVLSALINNKLLDCFIRPSMLTATPSPTVVVAITVTLYSEYGAEKEKKHFRKIYM